MTILMPSERCRICDCHDLAACVDPDGTPCGWAEDDLCTSCQEKFCLAHSAATAASVGVADLLIFSLGEMAMADFRELDALRRLLTAASVVIAIEAMPGREALERAIAAFLDEAIAEFIDGEA